MVSGVVSVQVVEKCAGKTVVLWHVGSAHDELSFSVLVEKAESFLGQLDTEGGQVVLNLGTIASKPKQYPCFSDIANYHDGGQLELPVSAAAETVDRDVTEHPTGVGRGVPQVVASPVRLTWDVLTTAYHQLGFDITGDEVFKAVVVARIIKPTSKVKARDVLID